MCPAGVQRGRDAVEIVMYGKDHNEVPWSLGPDGQEGMSPWGLAPEGLF